MAVINYNGTQRIRGLISLTAPWCGKCKGVAPGIEALDKEILKVDIEEYPEVAAKLGVMSIPALLEVHEEEVSLRLVGSAEIMEYLS